MNAVPFRHVSAFKGQSLGSKTDMFQQEGQHNEIQDVKLSLLSSV